MRVIKKYSKKNNLCRALRKYSTDSEKVLWEILRNRKVAHMKFRRQHYVNGFVLDFYCPEERLGIEIDGGLHKRRRIAEKDEFKARVVKEEGIDLVRFESKDILKNSEDVIDSIVGFIRSRNIF